MDISQQKNFVIQDIHNDTGSVIVNIFQSKASAGEGLIHPSPFGVTFFRYKHGNNEQEDELEFFKAVDKALHGCLDGIITWGETFYTPYYNGASRGSWLAEQAKLYKPEITTILVDESLCKNPQRWLKGAQGQELKTFKNYAKIMADHLGTKIEIPEDFSQNKKEHAKVLKEVYKPVSYLDHVISGNDLLKRLLVSGKQPPFHGTIREYETRVTEQYLEKFPSLRKLNTMLLANPLPTAPDFRNLQFSYN